MVFVTKWRSCFSASTQLFSPTACMQATPTMKTARMPSRISYRYVEIYALRSCDMAYNALLSDDWVCGVAIDLCALLSDDWVCGVAID